VNNIAFVEIDGEDPVNANPIQVLDDTELIKVHLIDLNVIEQELEALKAKHNVLVSVSIGYFVGFLNAQMLLFGSCHLE
jgi:hypothetical protein